MVADFLLFTTALIWGFAFVAQRVGMDFVGPFAFNAVRFLLGALSLIPLVVLFRRKRRSDRPRPFPVGPGMLAGTVLFVAASLQQIGLVYTTAGNAAFITGLYVVFVPLLGLFRGQQPGGHRWFAALLAAAGMYLLSVGEGFAVNPGDLYVLGAAAGFALHVQVIGHVAGRYDPLEISVVQYTAVGILSGIVAMLFEQTSAGAVTAAAPAILYGGLGSITVAYTLQTIAQRTAHPAHAAILLSLEGAFGALGGWLLLGEVLSPRALAGCALMLTGMLTSQLVRRRA